jgi:hypothetical protein
MEPRGCNQWQPAANQPALKAQEQAKSVATGCRWLRHEVHGKEAAPGSSPGEGLNTCKSASFSTIEPLCVKGSRVGSQVGSGEAKKSLQIDDCPMHWSTSVLRRASTVWPLSG